MSKLTFFIYFIRISYLSIYRIQMSLDFIFQEDIPLIKNRVKLGLCCINNELNSDKKNRIYCNRTLIRRTFTVDKAKDCALKNVKDIIPLVDWNVKNNIHHLRLSSDMFPHYTDRETEKYTMDFCDEELKRAGEHCRAVNQRITMHPGQYNQVGAKSQSVFDHTVDDLSMHAEILDRMGMDNNAVLCVHGGGLYGDKESAIRRWIEQYDDLPKSVKSRLAIENCEKCYCVRDCLEIAQATGIPLIYDTHHYSCYSILHKEEEQEPIEDMMDEIVDTWKKTSRVPVFHISEQAPDKRIGAHSDYIETLPSHLLDVVVNYDTDIHIEVEAKAKEKAIKKLMTSYDYLF
jgi:UV DNA damage endonuclease